MSGLGIRERLNRLQIRNFTKVIEPVSIPSGNEIDAAIGYFSDWDIESINRDIEKVVESRKNGNGSVNIRAWRLIWRARIVQELEQSGLTVVNEIGKSLKLNWKNVIRNDNRDFESQFFEFEIAALLSSYGLSVSFVEGSGHRPAPDLLVDGDLWVECKRKADEIETETWVRERSGILDDVLDKGMELDNNIHSFSITFSGSKSYEEIEDLSSTLRWMVETDRDLVDGNDYSIRRTEKSVKLSDDGKSVTIGEEYHTPGVVDSKILTYNDENLDVKKYTGAELRFEFADDWFYPKKVFRRLKEAKSRNLSEKEKGAVFVYIPQLYLQEMQVRSTPPEELAPESDSVNQFKRLGEMITKLFLNKTERVNIVGIYSDGMTENIGYFPTFGYWENKDCKHPDHGDFSGTLERIRKSYYGYLLSNSKDP